MLRKRDISRKIIDQKIKEFLSSDKLKTEVFFLEVLTEMIKAIEDKYFDLNLKEKHSFYFESRATLFPIVFLPKVIHQIPLLGSEFGSMIAVMMIQFIGSMAIDFYERRDINDYLAQLQRKTKENQYGGSDYDFLIKEFDKVIAIAKQFKLENPDHIALANTILLSSDAFKEERPPVIAITGMIGAGKSSLVNALFGEKIADEGLLGDTTDVVGIIPFRSRLLLYDTPGIDGLKIKLGNITRLFFGLKQISDSKNQVEAIPTIELPVVEKKEPISRQPEDLEQTDLVIFVHDARANLGLTEFDFLNEIIGLGKPVIILFNKIDLEIPKIVRARLKHLQNQELFPMPDIIPVSTETGENLDKLLRTIILKLPATYDGKLDKTVNKQYEQIVRTQEIFLHSLITAVRTAVLMTPKGKPHDMYQVVANVLGLYFWITHKYKLSQECLKETNLGFEAIAHSIQQKKEYVRDYAKPGKDALVGGTLGLTIVGAIATAVFIIPPSLLPINPLLISVLLGGPVGGSMLGGLNAMLRRNMVWNMQPEFEQLQTIIPMASRFETAVSVFAFGQALSQCCEEFVCDVRRREKVQRTDFSDMFQRCVTQSSEQLSPFKEKLNRLTVKTEQSLIREIVEAVLTQDY